MDHLSPASLPPITRAARLASVLEDGFGSSGAVTESDLLAKGFSQADLNAHLPEARRLAKSRFVRQVAKPAAERFAFDDPQHPVHLMAELILQSWRAGNPVAEHHLHDMYSGSGFCAGEVIDHYFDAMQLAIRWRDLQDGTWKTDRRYR